MLGAGLTLCLTSCHPEYVSWGDDCTSVINAVAYDMDHMNYERGYRLHLHSGDIVFTWSSRRNTAILMQLLNN